MIEKILEKIDKLPTVPNIVNELQEMYYMDDYNAADIERVLKKDPNMMANLLKVVNSPYYGFAREIYDVRQAIVLFGLDQIIEFAFASFVNDLGAYNLDFYTINRDIFLKLSQEKSKIAKELLSQKSDKLFVGNCAFLSDVAKVIISQYAKEEGLEALKLENDPLNFVDEKEKEVLGFDTIEVSVKMFEYWNFEERMIELLSSFKKRSNPLENALFVSREVVTIEGDILEEQLEELKKS